MDPALENLGWTEDQWNQIVSTVTDEAQRARVAAQLLPVSGPESPDTVAVPNFTLESSQSDPYVFPPNAFGRSQRLSVDSDPVLFLTTIAINIQLRTTEMADPELKAALVMFRRAANHIARIEDALVFNGRPPNAPPVFGLKGIPKVFSISGGGSAGVPGIFRPLGTSRKYVNIVRTLAGTARGQPIVNAVVDAIDQLEQSAQLGPYACVLGHELFEDVCDPTANLVLPRDRILPFLQGPLLRSSAVPTNWGAVVALSGNPVEIVVASDIAVNFLQVTPEPRFVFRVSERVAVRIKDGDAIALLRKP
jgi:uncharacterized linocin/CFP29 family protein